MPEKKGFLDFVSSVTYLALFDLIIGLLLNFIFFFPFWVALPLAVSLLMFLIFFNHRAFSFIFNEPPMYGTLVRWS
jgi:hypothetical protein